MSDKSAESSEIQKRIKHLQNQNIKFKHLLRAYLDIAEQDVSSVTQLEEEAVTLRQTIQNLEKEQLELQNELNVVLEDDDHEIAQTLLTVNKLKDDDVDLRTRIEEIKKHNLELESLKTENKQLNQILDELEKVKLKLLEEIKKRTEDNL